MMVLATSPPQSPLNPRALAEEVKVEPLALFMYDTMVSGGCDTTAQTTEKKYLCEFISGKWQLLIGMYAMSTT